MALFGRRKNSESEDSSLSLPRIPMREDEDLPLAVEETADLPMAVEEGATEAAADAGGSDSEEIPIYTTGPRPENPLPLQPAAQVPVTPLRRERIAAILTEDGDSFEQDEDGDYYGRWDDEVFHFNFYGEDDNPGIFQVVGFTISSLDSEFEAQLQLFVDDWNLNHYWPKALVRRVEGNRVVPAGEITFDYRDGVTDAQLRQHLLCAFGTIGAMCKAATEQFSIPSPDED